ncbi:hypothetical protein FQN60_005284 [Etheostoma spectabile]|uniref:Uncharacterized protein n=1 Tax=Etheostoma spectabile TaxID=54343 RepID=A0A5J5C8H3_9PERO|nr:hypothetical protein FQN60_005284 [Etheostoma spectabile]
MREKRWEVPGVGILAPDLIFIKSGEVLIVDVIVRYELRVESLEMAQTEKVETCVLEVSKAKVFGFPIGA